MIVRQLHKIYQTPKGPLTVLNGVSFTLEKGQSLAVVGESGAGKSSIAKCILGIEPFEKGEVMFEDMTVNYHNYHHLRRLWESAQMIWQDPFLAVSPYLPVWKIIAEPLFNFKKTDKKDAIRKVDQLLEMVGLDTSFSTKRSHQLSGGECQRVCIARALSVNPGLLICDEPVSALDLPMQIRIMDLIEHLRDTLGLMVILITHDMGLAFRYADSIAVLKNGRIVQNALTDEMFSQNAHPYTRKLISAVPELNF